MKTLVLDATELSKDFLLTGLKYQLLEHTGHLTWLEVCIPASVFEEVVANHSRASRAAVASLNRANRDRRRVGLPALASASDEDIDYRDYLTNRLDSELGITVLDWPSIDHAELVGRAVQHQPPFNEKGSGYRDSLVWASVMELVQSGRHVALASDDNVFADSDGTLTENLVAEVKKSGGRVELVRDLSAWLIGELPWTSDDLTSALDRSRTSEFYDYYLQSDLQENLWPEPDMMGFPTTPLHMGLVSVDWGGNFDVGRRASTPDGQVLIEYELDQVVAFEARFRGGVPGEEGWVVSEPDTYGEVTVTGKVSMIVRLGVLYGGEFGFAVDQLSWRRAAGTVSRQG